MLERNGKQFRLLINKVGEDEEANLDVYKRQLLHQMLSLQQKLQICLQSKTIRPLYS